MRLCRRVVDVVRERVGHGDLGQQARMAQQLLLLTDLADADGGEISENFHDPHVAPIKCRFPLVRQDVEGSASGVGLPGKHEAVGDGPGEMPSRSK